MADREKFVKCDCHGEGMLVTKFDGEEEMYFSYWRQGIDPTKLSWWMRLKLCWMVLTKGSYFEDEVILNKEKAIELALWIQEEHDDITTWVREMDKEGKTSFDLPEYKMDKTKFAVGNLLDRKSSREEVLDWENEGGSNLSSLPDEGSEGGHY
jgi:hypothetical protein